MDDLRKHYASQIQTSRSEKARRLRMTRIGRDSFCQDDKAMGVFTSGGDAQGFCTIVLKIIIIKNTSVSLGSILVTVLHVIFLQFQMHCPMMFVSTPLC